MSEIIKLVLSLFFITTIATALLSLTYAVTKPVIQETREQNFQEQMQGIFPDSDSTKEVGDYFEVYQVGQLIGYAAVTTASGYSSDIEILVGITTDGNVQGIAILNQLETPGLGSRITEEKFLDQFIGKTKAEIELRKFGGQIDAVTSATISSQAVTEAVRTKVEELR